jgi:hypothetical protein
MAIYFQIKFRDSLKMCLTSPIGTYRILRNYSLQSNYCYSQQNEYMKQTYFLDPRDKPGLLIALMRHLAGNAHIALEGDQEDMVCMNFDAIPGAVESLVPPFEHQWDQNSRLIVLPLTNETIEPILVEVLPEGRIVHKVGPIQIEKDGDIQFLSGIISIESACQLDQPFLSSF